MSDLQRREFQEALLDADTFEDLHGKWQAAIQKAEETSRICASLAVSRVQGDAVQVRHGIERVR